MKYVINDTTLTAIGDAVREKGGTTELIPVTSLADAITNLPSGGGGGDIPEEAFSFTGNCQYKFSYNSWNWFINMYGNKITTNKITVLGNMFRDSSDLENIPFELNCDNTSYRALNDVFNGCGKLKAIPKINNCKPSSLAYICSACYALEELPEDIETWFDWSYMDNITTTYGGGDMNGLFSNCKNLRRIPIDLLNHGNPYANYTGSIYYYAFNGCNSLDEIVGLPNPHLKATWTSPALSSATFEKCYRLKNLTFAMPDGQPYVVNWKGQMIDLSSYIGTTGGYPINASQVKVFTEENKVFSDLSYQALKDSPDWWTAKAEYSRYNHDSAVATINSLPDASAYLATAGGTNTIKFRGNLGSATDGGAISNLTAEEIAVASAKGWTVSII